MNKTAGIRVAVAAAVGLALTSSALAGPIQTVQITSGSMTTSESNPDGSWTLAGKDLSAAGVFKGELASELPGAFFSPSQPMPLGAAVGMSWFSDSIDGWLGHMAFHGVTYTLAGDANSNNSFMQLNASPITVGHVGTYMEPFTFTATFCGFLTVPMETCDATALLVGSGTLDLGVIADPQNPGSVDLQSLSYRFAGVPEPASIVLLLTGLFALGLSWQQTRCGGVA